MKQPELKPCPFCGSYRLDFESDHRKNTFQITCADCEWRFTYTERFREGIATAVEHERARRENPDNVVGWMLRDNASFLSAWNRRAKR